ncbi:MAG TPA: AbrB/MazE/SpoVT family DNA-binding domain-containing protein [Terriglobia bacterium]|jgi:AbrB family looped-hinge helix DNA binding protein
MKSVISSKGQITVPVQIRSRLGLQPGSVVTFEITRNGALLRKGGSGKHPVDQLYGILGSKRRTDELLDELRGPKPIKGRAKRR